MIAFMMTAAGSTRIIHATLEAVRYIWPRSLIHRLFAPFMSHPHPFPDWIIGWGMIVGLLLIGCVMTWWDESGYMYPRDWKLRRQGKMMGR